MDQQRVLIRKATPDDLPAIINLAVNAVVHSVSPFRDIDESGVKEFRRKDLVTLHDAIKQPHVAVFMAEDEVGRLLGHVIIVCGQMESSTGESQGWVFDLAVQEDQWSRGIGHRLMVEAEKFTRAQGHVYIGLGVTTANARAVHFYEKMGYAEERKRMIKRLDPENA
jgi:ribosomal protein S18 acetylase RimI-like enzyme